MYIHEMELWYMLELTELVWLVGPDGRDGDVDVLEGRFVVQLRSMLTLFLWN
jgi:hypothetical protein